MTSSMKAVVLVLAVLVVSVLGVATASGAWFVGGSELPEGGSAALSTSTTTDRGLVLQLLTGSKKTQISIQCESLQLINGRIFAPDGVFVGAIDFIGCHTVRPTPTNCQLQGGIALIKTGPVLALAALTTQTFKTETGKVFTEVAFEEGTACALEGSQPVKGEVTLGTPGGASEAASHTVEGLGSVENNSLEVGTGSKSFLLGKILVSLAGGSNWSFQ